MKIILEYDHIEQYFIFEDILTKKPYKGSLVKSLEGYLDKAGYDYCKSKDIATCVIVDFMSMIKKISFSKMSKISDMFEEMWKIICFIGKAGIIHIVYDSYIARECDVYRKQSH